VSERDTRCTEDLTKYDLKSDSAHLPKSTKCDPSQKHNHPFHQPLIKHPETNGEYRSHHKLTMTTPEFLTLPPTTTISTPRLTLRTVTLSDADAITPMVTDAEIMKYTSGVVQSNNPGAVRNWLAARVLGKDVFNFVVTLRKEDEDEDEVIVGMLGSYHWPEVGYMMGRGKSLVSFPFTPLHFDTRV
jgi:hypothetical protein